uniref:Nicotinate phosphoribosyltransferase n=1 Tax=Heligmosomoides polygyrus TaxID=6339 RepID=A0A183GIR1_HELPZ
LFEFGLRRAQGPNGGLTASKYCYVGGFDGTSNVLAGKLFGIPVKGTQAHSFICSFSSASDLKVRSLRHKCGSEERDLYVLSLEKRQWIMKEIEWGVVESEVSEGELTAFVAYALAFPDSNMALIDTYDVLRSGVINFIAVTLALFELGYKSVGCRIDSGDLAYLSKEVRSRLRKVAELDKDLEWVQNVSIVASNDINEETIMSLNEQSWDPKEMKVYGHFVYNTTQSSVYRSAFQHEIDVFGVGTHLVTCQKQPALGCVYKLVALSGHPKIKVSEEVSKITIPGRKRCFRLYGKSGYAILDLMTLEDEPAPKTNEQILCRHPFQARESKRALVVASRVEPLHELYWCGGEIVQDLPDLCTIKVRSCWFSDGDRTLEVVSVSEKLYNFLHSLWLQNAPIGQLE